MYFNLIQIAESFGVSEAVVEGWIRDEGLPRTTDRGRLIFDRGQVVDWATTRGLGAKVGFLVAEAASLGTRLQLAPLLHVGSIWRDVPTTPVRQLLAHRVRAKDGVTLAPIGGGLALPHPSSRVALGHESSTLALLLLREALAVDPTIPDGVPVTRLFFFIAPSPRAHLELLGRLSRLLARGPLRDLVMKNAKDEEIYHAILSADESLPNGPNLEVKC